MNNMRRGFTMIELIFVIVIIGILAAVAIPKLAATRDDAEASTCIHEVGQLIQEMSASYTKLGNATYVTSKPSAITNVQTGITAGSGKNGIVGDAVLASGTTISYECAGSQVAALLGSNAGLNFELNVTVGTGGTPTPAAAVARAAIQKDILDGNTTKSFRL